MGVLSCWYRGWYWICCWICNCASNKRSSARCFSRAMREAAMRSLVSRMSFRRSCSTSLSCGEWTSITRVSTEVSPSGLVSEKLAMPLASTVLKTVSARPGKQQNSARIGNHRCLIRQVPFIGLIIGYTDAVRGNMQGRVTVSGLADGGCLAGRVVGVDWCECLPGFRCASSGLFNVGITWDRPA